MFHSGDLQSGISLAIAESKLVACFVHSPSDSESATWETWLTNEILFAAISSKAVVLRIEAESKEASFLAAFCPIATTPTFVVIRNGQVLEKVEGGVSRDEFASRIGRAMDVDISGDGMDMETEVETEIPAAQITTAQQQQPQQEQQQHPDPATVNMTSLFPDRAARTSVQNDQVRSAEAAEKAARTAARRKEAEEAHAFHKDKGKGRASEGTDKGKEAARRDYLVQQSKAKQDAKTEKARILAQIEADRMERKARSQRAPTDAPAASSPMNPSADAASRRIGAGGMCALQIRLFDGTSIKRRFEPSATLEGSVREWITTQEGVGQEPFTFKMLRAPLPSRSIEIGEERQSLLDLGLTPNATLVLVPVKGYTQAYDGNEGRGYMSSALHLAYGMASGATGMLGAALTYVPGFGPSEPAEGKTATGPSEAIREDVRADAPGKKTEFYNGNSSAFESRKDDDGEGKRD